VADIERVIKKAKEAGFTEAAPLDLSTLELREDIRANCAANKCGMYEKSWTCPPGCGELPELREQLKKYKQGIIVQTYGDLEDEFDFETTRELMKKHNDSVCKLAEELAKEYDVLPLGAGACRFCETCAFPEPCRFPERKISSMEAYGLFVSDVCKKNNVTYYHGKNTQTFVGCYLLG
jgi:predicted metal-binding protein